MADTDTKEHKYSKCSTQVTLTAEEAEPILAFVHSIPKEDLYIEEDGSKGAEEEPHITALYGITDGLEDVKNAVKGIGPATATLGKTSSFESEEKPYDVLKVSVTSPDLRKINSALRKNTNFENEFDYTPHLTIAYLKKGKAKDYVGDDRFDGVVLTFDELDFCDRDGEKQHVLLAKDGMDESSAILPFGYWIDRSGNSTPVRDWGGHSVIAKNVFGVSGMDLEARGFVHVAIGSSWILHASNAGIPRWDGLTRHQRDSILKIAYDRDKVVHYNGNLVEDSVFSTVNESDGFSTSLKPETINKIRARLSLGMEAWRGVKKPGAKPADPGDFGIGEYHTTQHARARNYGTVKPVKLVFKNPLILTTEEAYSQIADRFGTITGNPDNPNSGSGEENSRLECARKASSYIRSIGYDGIAVVGDTDIELVKLPMSMSKTVIEAVFGKPSEIYRPPDAGAEEWVVAAALLDKETGDIYLGDHHLTAAELRNPRQYQGACDAENSSRAKIDFYGLATEGTEQGFYTNLGRFVYRQEAMALGRKSRQVRYHDYSQLDSSDLVGNWTGKFLAKET